mmetsp:Transcript_37589/g.118518  ORF Transcript_37589/g.118518 Transcript_37589/m.118518 type:complete len:419 (-) Transcript_37589:980-2236(-)|eukprot:CAMPEP_0182914336 /NCGR_PEP_ID=MMETSP0034_2-20130328/38520_1 /TAXON_ID=156128 /ORGANISM="Nephroselmis pyriformis, Strain CCMP717" /LENGTH=418 /DNA_ID=CAMNT_0025051115 /DNA_START=355 /DNA_END=1611 /DNA_ORIENTATION=+
MFRKTAAFALLATTDALEILSCLYGYARCLGLPSTNTYETAREWGCVTADGGVNGGAMASQWQRAFMIHSAAGTTGAVENMDGMPCVFKPDSYSAGEIADIRLSEIKIILNDGNNNTVAPLYGATLFPAIEVSESNTLLLLGDFGFPKFSSVKSVQIKEAVYVGEGLNYVDQGIYMNYATWYTEADFMKLDGPSPDILANVPVILRNQLTQQTAPTCRSVFGEGSTSHVIQVVGSGGMSITYDGSREMPHAFSNDLHKDMFELKIGDGTVLTSDQYLGLADFGDGENYIDLCLNLSAGVVAKITEHGLKVRLFSTRACNFIVPPKGDCKNDLVGADCGDSATYPHEICVSKIPNGKAMCVIGTDTYEKFDMTKQELASQKCMKASESSNNSDVSDAGAVRGLFPMGAALVVAAIFVHF